MRVPSVLLASLVLQPCPGWNNPCPAGLVPAPGGACLTLEQADDALGGVVIADSCAAADVQRALDDALAGSVVLVPPGDCDWGADTVTTGGGIGLRGAGLGRTVIRRTAAVTGQSTFLLDVDCDGEAFELAGMSFVGNDELQSEPERLVDLDDGVVLRSCRDFRVHDAEFSRFSDAGLTIRGGDARGVVHDCDFVSNYKCQPNPTSCLGYGVVVYGDTGAQPPLALGTEDAVFVEDSWFYDNRHAVASNQGSRYVVRHNTIVTTARTEDFGMVDAHGRGSYPPGSRSWEIYENTLETDPPGLSADGIYLRGGDGVVFGNTIAASIPYAVKLTDESDCSGTYPMEDQVREAYVWDNQWDGPVVIGGSCAGFIQEGRDYFLEPRPGYVPYPYPHPLR